MALPAPEQRLALPKQDYAPIVISEDMTRVQKYASKIGGETIDDFIPEGEWSKAANKEWIEQMKHEGRTIADIGPAFERRLKRVEMGIRPDSDIYNMERLELIDYQDYTRVFERNGRYFGGVPGLDC